MSPKKATVDLPPTQASRNGPVAKRRPFRQEQILGAAVRLFNERGYHATGMNDIGAAIGISGPGIYRHFKNKQAILEAALIESGERMEAHIRSLHDASLHPDAVLEGLVRFYVETLIEYPALSVALMAERRVLSDSVRASVNRTLRMHVEEWVTALANVRPELSELEARVIVHGALSLSYSIDRFRADLDRERLAALLERMTFAVLFTDRR